MSEILDQNYRLLRSLEYKGQTEQNIAWSRNDNIAFAYFSCYQHAADFIGYLEFWNVLNGKIQLPEKTIWVKAGLTLAIPLEFLKTEVLKEVALRNFQETTRAQQEQPHYLM